MIRQDWSTLKKLMFMKAAAGGGAAVEATATGNPLTFQTDLARPLKSLLIPFTPQQEGTGDPSPQNIRSILPWNGLSVGQINGTAPTISNNSGMANADGEWKNTITDSKTRFDAYIQLYKDSSYIKGAGSKAIASSGVYSITFNVDDANCNWIVFMHSGSQNNLSVRFPFNLPQGTYTISFNVVSANPSVIGGLAIKDIFLVEGSTVDRTDTDIVFPSPVYGGKHEAVSGKLMDAFKSVDLGSKSWTLRSENQNRQVWEAVFSDAKFETYMSSAYQANAKCSEFDLTTSNGSWTVGKFAPALKGQSKVFIFVFQPNSFADGTECKEAMDGIQLCYELIDSAKQEIQLTPAQITALVGDNTIWSDANGSMTAVYLKKG